MNEIYNSEAASKVNIFCCCLEKKLTNVQYCVRVICSEAGIESTALKSMNILTRNAPGVKNKRSGAIEPRPAPPRAYQPCILWSLVYTLLSQMCSICFLKVFQR